MDIDAIEACDFTFRAVDDDGAYCRYEALLLCADESNEPGGRGEPDAQGESGEPCASGETPACLVYADAEPDDAGQTATYVSWCVPAEVRKAQLAVDSGATPKKPPLLQLAPVEDPAVLDAVLAILDELDAMDDDEF